MDKVASYTGVSQIKEQPLLTSSPRKKKIKTSEEMPYIFVCWPCFCDWSLFGYVVSSEKLYR